MEKINRPGILVECGFISNPEDDALLQNEDYQKLLSAIIATTLIKTPSA
jgi:N-acetylmuramoyl-L-alanine amidase